MTWEELQDLKRARDAISNIANRAGYREEDPSDPYRVVWESLTEIINRWECTP